MMRLVQSIMMSSLTALSGLLLVIAASIPTGPAQAGDLVVSYDQSQLLRLPRPVASIIVGNPSIADVTVQDGNLLVVTGKTFGVTNVIALDQERNIIQDQRIVVRQDTARSVTLTKAGEKHSYTCTPECSATLSIGDSKEYFNMVAQHSNTKTQFSLGGNSGDQSSGAPR